MTGVSRSRVSRMAAQSTVLVFLWLLVLARTAVIPDECQLVELISRRLQYENRVLYMSDYFPIDYQLPVKYEEILQCQNISSLISEGITVDELRFLWGIVSENVLQSISRMLPQRHPSRSYIDDLQKIFNELHVSSEVLQLKQSAFTDDFLNQLWMPGDKVQSIAPRNLLDDCWRVLHVLYQERCDLCVPRTAPEETLCPNGTVPGLSPAQRPFC